MTQALVKFHIRLQSLRSERGATAVEYGLMVALIAVVIVVAVTALGSRLNGMFDGVSKSLPSTAPTP